MEVPFGFIFLALVVLVAMSFLLGWVVARSFQPVGTGTNITWFSGAPPADPNLTPEQSSERVRPGAEPAGSQSDCHGSPVLDPLGHLAVNVPVIAPEELSTHKGKYWINPVTFTLHRCVEVCAGEGSLFCGSKQPRRLEQVYLCEFCWPTHKKKSR